MRPVNSNTLILSLVALFVCTVFSNCGNGAFGGGYDGDTVAVQVVKVSDSSSFAKSNGDRCLITYDATVQVPTAYKDTQSIEALRKLFVTHVLYGGDSLTVDEALKQNLRNMLHQYDFADAPDSDEIEMDNATENVSVYSNSININVYYNKYNILTLCKVEVVKKDTTVTSVTHRYYNFDLQEMAYLDLGKIFREDAMTPLCNDLRNQFMANNKVTSNDQLNEIGYYNIDNLMVTNNFYFDNNGLTWSYMPNELAVEALGEPTVALPYDALEPYLTDKSVIKRL